MAVPALRISPANDASPNGSGRYVLYWCIAARRAQHNFALDRAVELCREHGVPLLVLEAVRCGYRWASDRHHAFLLQGMAENRRRFDRPGVRYLPYVEPEPGHGKGLVSALAKDAVAVVTDEWPCFFLPHMVEAAATQNPERLFELVDSCGLLPLRAPGKVFSRAFDFRRYLQREIEPHLRAVPRVDPLSDLKDMRAPRLPAGVRDRWGEASDALLTGTASALADLPIDHGVAPVEELGGSQSGEQMLDAFVKDRLERYGDDRNHPDDCAASGLSPWLHYGHVGAHQVLDAVSSATGWNVDRIANRTDGKADGWWGVGSAVDGFLDELVTWRELGLNFGHERPDELDQLTSLPNWAQKTLREHGGDERAQTYDLETLARAETHDEIWNAAQTELLRTGRMHNYLRMLWGKLVLAWKETPEEAAQDLIELNNRYALDGRDPNSYSGIFWVFGRYDRAWGPERPIYGKVRYMTSKSTRTKLRLKGYLERFGPGSRQGALFES